MSTFTFLLFLAVFLKFSSAQEAAQDERFFGILPALLGMGNPMMGGGYGMQMGGYPMNGMQMGGAYQQYPVNGMQMGGAYQQYPMNGYYPGAGYGHHRPMQAQLNHAYTCGSTCSHKIIACRFICVGNPMSHRCSVCIGPSWDMCKYCDFGAGGMMGKKRK